MKDFLGLLGAVLGLLGAVVLVIVYFGPTIIARRRKHQQKTAITVLNIFGGWTFLGWLVALVWAFTTPSK